MRPPRARLDACSALAAAALLLAAAPAPSQVTGDVEETSLSLVSSAESISGGVQEDDPGIGGLLSEGPEPDPEAEAEAERAERLVLAIQSTAPYREVRSRLQELPARLRLLLHEPGGEDFVIALLEQYDADMEAFRSLSASLALAEFPEIEEQAARLDSLLDVLARDYAARDERRYPTSLRLIEQSLARLEELAASAENRAVPQARATIHDAPGDWGEGRFGDPSLRGALAVQQGAELIDRGRALVRRVSTLGDPALRTEGEPAARELGEIARALVRRQAELEPSARPAFRNAALRLEVLAENMADFSRTREHSKYRRQSFEAARALDALLLIHREARIDPAEGLDSPDAPPLDALLPEADEPES